MLFCVVICCLRVFVSVCVYVGVSCYVVCLLLFVVVVCCLDGFALCVLFVCIDVCVCL